ncbi:MAG: DNA-binding protein WhiA, partial [Oscillospiraceae bacterium]
MSFSQQVKKEIEGRGFKSDCCLTSACYGVACFSRYFDTRGIVLFTEAVHVAKWAKNIFALAGIEG